MLIRVKYFSAGLLLFDFECGRKGHLLKECIYLRPGAH